MTFEQTRLNQEAITLVKGLKHREILESRSKRDWVIFDQLSPTDKLKTIIIELKTIKNGSRNTNY